MRRSSLNKSEFGMIPDNQTIKPPRLQQVQSMLRPENDVVSQYTPEQLMKIAQKRVQWSQEKGKRLDRERQLENDEVHKAVESQNHREREAAIEGSRRGQHVETFAVGRTAPLEVSEDGSVISPTRNQEVRTGLEVKRENVRGMDALDKADKIRRALPSDEAQEPSSTETVSKLREQAGLEPIQTEKPKRKVKVPSVKKEVKAKKQKLPRRKKEKCE